jgi:uncharacterized protein (TIGR00369 family)
MTLRAPQDLEDGRRLGGDRSVDFDSLFAHHLTLARGSSIPGTADATSPVRRTVGVSGKEPQNPRGCSGRAPVGDDDGVHISILLFDDVDLLDSGGPYEVFLTANRLAVRGGGPEPFEIDTVTLDGEPVTAYGGLGLIPTASGDVLERTDLIIVPGAVDLAGPREQIDLLDAIAAVARRTGTTVASVCTGAFLLDDVGLLGDRPWTTHWEDIDLLAEQTGSEGARRGVRWVDAGPVVTGGALSSGIALALHLVQRFAGRSLAERTANQIDYVWTEHATGAPPDADDRAASGGSGDGIDAETDTATRFPLQGYLGMELSGTTPGAGTARIRLADQHANPYGVVHGAVLFAMVDTAMGKATMSVVDEGHCASVELSLRFIRPASEGELIAEATVVKRGRSVVHLEARVHDSDDRLIATSTGTFAIFGV